MLPEMLGGVRTGQDQAVGIVIQGAANAGPLQLQKRDTRKLGLSIATCRSYSTHGNRDQAQVSEAPIELDKGSKAD